MSTETPGTAVVVDTNVFSAGLSGRYSPLADRYAVHLVGRRLVISFQTAAEMRFGALRADWGVRRRRDLEDRISRAVVIPADDQLTIAYAQLRDRCRRHGHPLGANEHTADCWIGATALHVNLPLVSDDRVFHRCPGLVVVREPPPAAPDPRLTR